MKYEIDNEKKIKPERVPYFAWYDGNLILIGLNVAMRISDGHYFNDMVTIRERSNSYPVGTKFIFIQE